MTEIYEPAEDSYLIAEALDLELPDLLRKSPRLKLLEVGVGSGINLEKAKSLGVKNILGTDININAVNHCKKLGFNCIKSDLFENIHDKFDVIVFNPPYLPLDEREPKDSRINTTAGKKGSELIIKFLSQAGEHLAKNGKIFLITSSLAPKIDFSGLGYNSKILSLRNLFFEKIFVWELSLYINQD